MNSLIVLLKKALCETGTDEKKALQIVETIITWGAENGHAGERYYWPCAYRPLSKAELVTAIKKDFTGANIQSLCERYRVTPQTVYRVLRQP